MIFPLLIAATLIGDGWEFRKEGETEWRSVRVPHDWAIEGGFLTNECPGQGDLPFTGVGHYRRPFDGYAPPPGGRTYLTLDGVMNRSTVRLNGKTVGGRPFGYASETIDVTDFLKPSGNLLEVDAENVADQCRWYSGAGIFREVTVKTCPKDHVRPNSLFIRTETADERTARVAVSFEWTGGTSNYVFTVDKPRLWSPEDPQLCELELFGEKFRYGIRTAEFFPDRGFFLNGRHRQLRGVCLHHDLGPVGAAFDRDVARRQLTLLREMGCDAIRTSHNPPAAALLDLCDELGVMVLDEAFDMWEQSKGDYARYFREWHERDLRNFVRRDRGHPCVIMWSIGNELVEHIRPELAADGIRLSTELRGIVRSEDPTRPVAFGAFTKHTLTNGCQKAIDVFGANYLPFRYAEFSKANPEIGLVGTETCSCVSSRGEYFFPVVASPIAGERDLALRTKELGRMVRGAQMSGYDLWGPHTNDYPPDVEFRFQMENPQVYGEFVWTGFDYLGEPDPCSGKGGRSSYFGIFDLAGFPKDRYWLYLSEWRPEVPCAHVLPHWTWPGREGEVTPVHVYSSGDEAELFVNGVSQGRRRRGKGEYRFRWDEVVYRPGEVRVETWRNGRPWASEMVKTAGPVARIERSERVFGRTKFITFRAVDRNGVFCPTASDTVRFAPRPGERLMALCNGDASSRESFRGTEMRLYNGLLLAIVREFNGD